MPKDVQVTRWAARVLAAALFLVILAFLIGEGVPDPRGLTTRELWMFGGLFLMLLGAVVGWKREAWGGVLLLAGFLFFCVVDNLDKRSLNASVWIAFAPFAVVGILYLAAALGARAQHR